MKLKTDKYRSARGGYSRLLDIQCKKCGTSNAKYQKDGAGNLRRMYLDRIIAPEKVAKLKYENISDIPDFKCSNCKETLGVSYIYQKEKRKAFRIFQDAIVKKIVKAK